MKLYAITLLNGICVGSLYFVVACSFSLIFGLLRTVNLAHGAFYLLGAYASFEIGDRSGSWLIGLAGGALVTCLVGIFCHSTILSRSEGDPLRQALLTIAIAIIVADVLLWRYGGISYQLPVPEIVNGAVRLPIAGSFPLVRLTVIAVAVLIGIGLWMLLNLTRLGIAIRAGVDDRVMLASLGFDVGKLYLLIFGIGALLLGVAGSFGGTIYSISPGEDARMLLASLVVVIVGGLGSLTGTALGALLVGIAEQCGLVLFPSYAVALTFALMVLVLAVRPQGLAGKA